jgi:hypothetical protein
MNRFLWLDRPRAARAGLLALLLCATLTGCGANRAEVTGTVRYNGKPLPYGTIQFLGSDGVPCSGPIQPDGTYSVQVPAGPAQVIVSCVDEARLNQFTAQMASGRGRAAPPPRSAQSFSLIPQRYADWNSSGLTLSVEHGKNVQDFALTN